MLRALLFTLLPLYAGPLAAQDAARVVPVHLFEREAPEVLVVEAEAAPVRLFAGEAPAVVAELDPGAGATIRRRGEELHVQTDDLSFYALSLRLEPGPQNALRVGVESGQRTVAARSYAGALAIAPDEATTSAMRLVNHVPLDAYVAAVVASEYGFDDLEGSKAMAVLARTYALRSIAEGRPLVDHVRSQQYDGAHRVTPVAREAVRATAGEVLTYGGALAEALYFASSGGHTASNESVWDGRPVPYLRGIPDPYDAASPYARWEATVPRRALLDLLSRTYGFSVDGFYLGERGHDGRIATIKLLRPDRSTGRVIKSNAFRLLVNDRFGNVIKSTRLDARRDGDRYVFTGSGYGHGVGLSQYGAREMARQGYDYQRILAYYFAGTALARLDGAASVPVLTEAPLPAPPPKAPTTTARKRRVGW